MIFVIIVPNDTHRFLQFTVEGIKENMKMAQKELLQMLQFELGQREE